MINKNLSSAILLQLKKHPLDTDISVTPDALLRITQSEARKDEVGYKEISLQRFVLPPNSVYPKPTKLVDHEILFLSTIYAVSEYSRNTPSSKSKANRIAFMLTITVKFMEYIWLNDTFDLKDLSPHTLKKLPCHLANGGWHEALNISERLSSFLATANDYDHPVFTSTNSKKSISSAGFQLAISTNITGKETSLYFDQVQKFKAMKGWPSAAKNQKETLTLGMNYSSLRQTLEALNYLYRIPNLYRLGMVPYPEYSRLSKRLTDTPGRTKNINSYGAGKMLEEALTLLYEQSDAILETIHYAGACLSNIDGRNIKTKLNDISLHSKLINPSVTTENIYKPITIKHLNHLTRDLLTACFLIIAIFNARRRDEITHRKLGISLGACTVYNKENNIFEMMFYIEKNRKDYLPFYVGNATQKAAEALEKLQLIYLNIDYKTHSIGKLKDTNITLFRHKLFSAKGFLGSYTDYNFEAYKTGQAYHFISSRLKFEIHSTPHMFRRLYCTIFMNQHEFPHLPALSYQLQHECLATTQIYITSPITQSEAATLSKIYDWQIEEYIDTHKHHNNDIAKYMDEAIKEKFSEIIYRIISNDSVTGGYTKMVRVLFRRLQKSVTFKGLDDRQKIDTFIERLSSRGHAPSTFKHAQCLAGNNRIKSRSKCYELSDNTLHKENATPQLCSNCPFSFTSIEHIKGLEQHSLELSNQIKTLCSNSIIVKNLEIKLQNLYEIIEYHHKKLAGG